MSSLPAGLWRRPVAAARERRGARDRAVVWRPRTQAASAARPMPVAGAEGAWLELADGRRIFDGIAGWWASIHGHANPRIVAAIAEQARTLDHVLLAGYIGSAHV